MREGRFDSNDVCFYTGKMMFNFFEFQAKKSLFVAYTYWPSGTQLTIRCAVAQLAKRNFQFTTVII